LGIPLKEVCHREGDSMYGDFGKDLDLVHDAVVMGRKVGAFKKFWNALANYRIAFEVIVGLPSHLALMQRNRLFNVIPEDKTEELLEWINSLDPEANCLLNISPNREAFGFDENWEKENKKTEPPMDEDDIRCAVYNDFVNELFGRIGQMGITPMEIALLPSRVFIEDPLCRSGVRLATNVETILISDLIRDIKIAIAQRNFAREMLLIKE